jgi:glucokinase
MAQDVREVLLNEPPSRSRSVPEGLSVSEGHRRQGRQGGDILRELVGDNLELITGQVVSEAAAGGDNLAQEILYRAGWALGVGIGNVANLINPQQFVLGGGVTKAGEDFWEVLRRVARETALPKKMGLKPRPSRTAFCIRAIITSTS